jgi:hypothetical protein
MATRAGVLSAEFEASPTLLMAIANVLEECSDRDCAEVSTSLVADLKRRVESLEWAPPPDYEEHLVQVAASSLCALAALHEGRRA